LGEIFHRTRSEQGLEWTGERLVTGIGGRIESEHLHRYFLARSLCGGKDVLDIASGEGYGTSLLAQTAATATGVEIDPVSVEHASRTYQSGNLRYLQGDAACIPLNDQSVDIVVSFETIEHFLNQELFLREVRRVLRPGGFLIVSTPDSDTYSAASSAPNPYHKRELTRSEFLDELHAEFSNVLVLRQRQLSGSAILPEIAASGAAPFFLYEQRDTDTFEAYSQLPHAPYLIAIASNSQPPPVGSSIYIPINAPELPPHVTADLERLRVLEADVRKQAPLIEENIAELRRDASNAREEAKRVQILHDESLAAATRRENSLIQREDAVVREKNKLIDELIGERNDLSRTAKDLANQLKTADSLARHQVLAVRRLQHEAAEHEKQMAASRSHQADVQVLQHTNAILLREIADLRAGYDKLAKLIVPVWMRKLIPSSFRSPLRGLKRALRNG